MARVSALSCRSNIRQKDTRINRITLETMGIHRTNVQNFAITIGKPRWQCHPGAPPARIETGCLRARVRECAYEPRSSKNTPSGPCPHPDTLPERRSRKIDDPGRSVGGLSRDPSGNPPPPPPWLKPPYCVRHMQDRRGGQESRPRFRIMTPTPSHAAAPAGQRKHASGRAPRAR
jgi:hypothetical protein